MSDNAALHLDERWDRLIELSLRRLSYGAVGGGAFGLLFLRGPTSRAAAVAFGCGVGLGSAWQLCSKEFEDLVPSLLKK